MEIIIVDSLNLIPDLQTHKTELTNRVLWYDGDSTVTEETLMRAIVNGLSTDGMFVEKITPHIKQYNESVTTKSERIGVKETFIPLKYDWNIPDEYKEIDIVDYVSKKLIEQLPLDDLDGRASRIAHELELYEKLDLMDVLRTLIFVINTLIENKVVWGVGRGSSVSSYVLYLIGVHDVDSFKYGLNIEEFLRTE